jgi:hypothetical protein
MIKDVIMREIGPQRGRGVRHAGKFSGGHLTVFVRLGSDGRCNPLLKFVLGALGEVTPSGIVASAAYDVP